MDTSLFSKSEVSSRRLRGGNSEPVPDFRSLEFQTEILDNEAMAKKRVAKKTSKLIVCFVTCKDEREAVNIAKALLEKKLCACVNIIKNIRSLYTWKEKLCDDHETLLIIKTKEKAFDRIAAEIKRLHSYEVPEIIALPVSSVLESYAKWVAESVL